MINKNFPVLFEYAPDYYINLKEIVDITPSVDDPNVFWYHVGTSIHNLPRTQHNRIIKYLSEMKMEE